MTTNKSLHAFLFIIIAYFCMVLLPPVESAIVHKFSLTQVEAKLLNLSVILPMSLIWLTALYGSWTLKNYAQKIENTPDGRGLGQLAKGLVILAFSLPTLALIGSVNTHLVHAFPEYATAFRLIRHFVGLMFTFVAFKWISDGAEELSRRVMKRTNPIGNLKRMAPIIIIASSLFSWIIVAVATQNHDKTSIYSMPQWFIVIGVIIPYLYIWYRGLTAVYYVHFYGTHVKGHVYRKAFSYIAKGLAGVVILAITIQFLQATSPQLHRLNFTPILIAVYSLIALYSVGYGMIAVGARKLKKIEEV